MTDTDILDGIRPRSEEMAEGRYEFRVWPRGPASTIALLHSRWPLAGAETRADIYLSTTQSPWTLVKLRAGTRLEIKRRGTDLGVLQYWTCPVSAEFPLSRRLLRALAGALGLPGGLPPEAALTPAHLLAALALAAPRVTPVTVRKARLTFCRGTCRAEICRAAVFGRMRKTVAIEDADPRFARAGIAVLGIDGLPNLSYGDLLRPRLLPLTGPRRTPTHPEAARRPS